MATFNTRLIAYRRYKSGDNPLVKFISTVTWVLSFAFALVVAYDHCLGTPILSGWAGLVIMTVLPQAALVGLYCAYREG